MSTLSNYTIFLEKKFNFMQFRTLVDSYRIWRVCRCVCVCIICPCPLSPILNYLISFLAVTCKRVFRQLETIPAKYFTLHCALILQSFSPNQEKWVQQALKCQSVSNMDIWYLNNFNYSIVSGIRCKRNTIQSVQQHNVPN